METKKISDKYPFLLIIVNMDKVFRIIDANYNRAREGLRVMEECARFILDNTELTSSIKSARHALSSLIGQLPNELLTDNRDTPGDVGTELTLPTETSRKDLNSVIKAAAGRLSEALRAIEEYSKLSCPEISAGIEKVRYQGYELEKQLISLYARNDFNNVKLYVLITEEYCKYDPIKTAELILKGGTDCIQYREKELNGNTTISIAKELMDLCSQYNAKLIINDRCDLTLACRAHGVHLGQDDLPPAIAREILGPSSIIGQTCHNLDEVSAAKNVDIDYIGIGSIFGSQTKPGVEKTGTEYIRSARKIYDKPIIAIGGVNKDNAAEAIEAGADGVAVCQAIISASDPQAAAEQIKTAITN